MFERTHGWFGRGYLRMKNSRCLCDSERRVLAATLVKLDLPRGVGHLQRDEMSKQFVRC